MAWGYKKPDRTESKTYHTTEVVVNSVAQKILINLDVTARMWSMTSSVLFYLLKVLEAGTL